MCNAGAKFLKALQENHSMYALVATIYVSEDCSPIPSTRYDMTNDTVKKVYHITTE